jgi:hypothetical protein
MKLYLEYYISNIRYIIMDRGRTTYYDPSKKRKRSGSKIGRIKLGNCEKKFCSHCRPTLAKRLSNKKQINYEIKDVKSNFWT